MRTKVIKGIMFLFLIVFLSACSINQNKESFRIFDDTQSYVSSKELKNDSEINRLKKILRYANWSNKLRPDSESDYTIKYEKEGQTELINNYNVWFEDGRAIIVDNFNNKYGTFEGVNAQKLNELLNIENKENK